MGEIFTEHETVRRTGMPIVEQYAAIRARQAEIFAGRPHAVDARSGPPQTYAVSVRHAKQNWFVSGLTPPDGAQLNPLQLAAMRFGSPAAAAALIERVPALREKAQRNEAGVVAIAPMR